ncbi:MAG: hypothetical protein ACJ74B_13575 [Gaiellaceae bacterium]
MGIRRLAATGGVAALIAVIPALAAPPSNDDRASARSVSVPAMVNGTTRESTLESNDPPGGCTSVEGTVWYSLDPAASGRVAIELGAKGDLEGVIEVFRRDRSQLERLDCDVTNRRGDASVVFGADKDERYLIRVGEQFDSESGDFTLDLFRPEPEATPPGRRLPRRGGVATVDRARDLTDAWSKRLRAGVPYVVTVASRAGACQTVDVYEPGINSFDSAEPVDGSRCNAHNLFTPDRSGRHSFLVQAGRGERGPQRYRLRVRRARRDDTAPGNILRNYERVRGHVGPGRADVVDLHRFYVTRRSDVTLRFASDQPLTLELRNVRGLLVDTSTGTLRRELRRGRFYATVRAGDGGTPAISGRYTLQPVVRDITRSGIKFNGRRQAVISPGQAATAAVKVQPAARGTITITVQRLDPLEGWQFYRRFTRRTRVGRAQATFVPRTPGRFRARAIYSGSRLSAPSETGFAYVSAREQF